jgi:rhodanese-related sulfurtransferase
MLSYNPRSRKENFLNKETAMKEVSPQEASDLMNGDPEYVYLDVRSVPEFEAGHAKGAINIPLMHLSSAGMTPNPEFGAVVEAALEKDAKLLIGCKTGVRSARACDLMNQMGFTNVANVRGGYVGAMDNTGRIVEPGWSMLNLPTCTECSDDARYEAISAKSNA